MPNATRPFLPSPALPNTTFPSPIHRSAPPSQIAVASTCAITTTPLLPPNSLCSLSTKLPIVDYSTSLWISSLLFLSGNGLWMWLGEMENVFLDRVSMMMIRCRVMLMIPWRLDRQQFRRSRWIVVCLGLFRMAVLAMWKRALGLGVLFCQLLVGNAWLRC